MNAIAVTEEMVEQPALLTRSEAAYVTETPTGLLFSENTPQAVWESLTTRLIQKAERIHWALADALIFGERKYGETYANAVKLTGMKAETLMNIASVGRKIETSRRREDVEFWDHREVAALPPKVADALLDDHVQQGWTRHELRDKARQKKTELAVEAARAMPLPHPSRIPPNIRVEVADVAARIPLTDQSVHLIVTSPPYGVGLDDYQDGGDVLAADWPSFMLDWLVEALRVTVDTGRLALNVPLDTSKGGYRPTYAHAVQMAEAAGWEYRSTILWIDDQLGKSTARGSMDSAGAPHVVAGAECVALFSKGEWKRTSDRESDLAHDEWVEWANGIWRFPGEGRAFGGHPAPFPYELPRRLIKYLSFPGDVILDPFSGSGTTALAAHRLARDFVGFDRSPEYVKLTLRRVVEAQ
jgi:DNA modification methylase